ncbi:sensor histidine kinase [Janthinobacterium fluminis]|uniref:Sensor histidine kinase n=1 Tax=Janthinobacterium fluminis TaxID=2987524 RepID=A0ABT5JWB8_9BURK|nr:sensor histidine kinase [Janthinobacterium fluminis]MDC8756448.1 sensor histidine kinase [Janthinobacterium fluminis]
MDLVANIVGDGRSRPGPGGHAAALALQEQAREEERCRIARDLHDELGGLLTGIRAYLAVALEQCADGRALSPQYLRDGCALTDAAIDAVRRVVGELRPGALDQLGLWDALAWLARQCAEHGGLACAVDVDPACAAVRLSPARAVAVFRIFQEALANVLRHAGASRVSLDMRRDGAAVMLRLADDGRGVAGPGAGPHWGLLGMAERARGLGAELGVEGMDGRGTVVALRLPLTDDDA